MLFQMLGLILGAINYVFSWIRNSYLDFVLIISSLFDRGCYYKSCEDNTEEDS